MDLPDAARALSYVDLKSGRMGSEALDYSKYQLQLTSPYFSITDDGKVSVDVPQDVRYLECELTITYLQGKMAFSNYDMSVTIPMIWTNLGLSELKEFYTVSV
ncbi:MAG: hypothetical protein IKU95_03465, partial [Clostridia bacterium]|nr:hypothetical protein [Clostridia bacterium]